jgi:hypothetical protein
MSEKEAILGIDISKDKFSAALLNWTVGSSRGV